MPPPQLTGRRELSESSDSAHLVLSILIPCRNEAVFIAGCLDSILANEFPHEKMEILVLDGMSTDGTREIIAQYTATHAFIKLIDNQRRTTPTALNVGVKSSKGSILMRMDAHAHYDRTYISRCVQALESRKADNVGGVWQTIPRTYTLMGDSIVKVLSHPFGVGNSHFRLARCREPMFVDTVPFFCVRRELFEELGGFNEQLIRSQDMEFSRRLQVANKRTLLLPDVVSRYYARSDPKSFWMHNWINGVWAVLPFAYSSIMPVRLRHLVPLLFVGSLISLLALSFWKSAFLWPLVAILGSYMLCAAWASLHTAWTQQRLGYVFAMPMIFTMLHVGYGLGSLWGMMKLITLREFWSRLLGGTHRDCRSA